MFNDGIIDIGICVIINLKELFFLLIIIPILFNNLTLILLNVTKVVKQFFVVG